MNIRPTESQFSASPPTKQLFQPRPNRDELTSYQESWASRILFSSRSASFPGLFPKIELPVLYSDLQNLLFIAYDQIIFQLPLLGPENMYSFAAPSRAFGLVVFVIVIRAFIDAMTRWCWAECRIDYTHI